MEIWIPARIERVFRAAAAWASDPDVGTESVRRWAVLGAVGELSGIRRAHPRPEFERRDRNRETLAPKTAA